jgi:membrane protease YdiL (CAAX protease family)
MKRFPKPNSNEILFGFIYFLLQLLVIPGILVGISFLLPNAMSEAVLNFLCFAVNFVAVLVIFRKFLWKNITPVLETPWNVLRWAGIGFVIYMIGNTLFGWVVGLLNPDFVNINDSVIMEMVQNHFGLMTAGTVLLVPIAEECFYRGLIFRGIYDKSPVLAYAVSMVLFSLAHVLGYVTIMDFGTLVLSFFQYLPAGFALALAYRQSGSIYASVLIHMTVNQIGMLLMR